MTRVLSCTAGTAVRPVQAGVVERRAESGSAVQDSAPQLCKKEKINK